MNILTNDEVVADGLQRISEAARFLGISRSLLYRLINNGVLPTVRIGRSRRIPIRSVRDFAARNLMAVSSLEQ
jgi:excisionase family DNA binding protein